MIDSARWTFTRHAAVLSCVTAAMPTLASAQDQVPFTPGMVVTESVRVQPGDYSAAAPSDTAAAVIVVRGDGLTLDLTGVTLRGAPEGADPDERSGVGIRIEGGTDVTIKGARIEGYHIAILASETQGLSLIDNDLSHNWKPRLFSVLEHESLVDWLSYHNNENREWMRFGSAIYLERVTGGVIRGNRSRQGMNALLMVYTDSMLVEENDFSYNSGLGVGLYHSSGNTIAGNLIDYNVRGYSEGHYQRGQDSAGILLYAQSSNNVIAYNSATHSGDGLFLWAGQHTMDTGEGGANDNLIFHNDFSYAPTNAVEVTFSRNRVLGNYLRGSRYGIWGGYSFETLIQGNCFASNQYGVAIEHGQDNVIADNRMDGDSLAISLWTRESEPADWGYARLRDTRSRDHRIEGNTFAAAAELWRLERTAGHQIGFNRTPADIPAQPCDPRALLGESFDRLAAEVGSAVRDIPAAPRSGLPRADIVVDEWGPYDGTAPKLWPTDPSRSSVPLRAMGPAGRWEVTGQRGIASLSRSEGTMGDTLVVDVEAGREGDWSIELRHRPDAPDLEPSDFSFQRFEPLTPWTLAFFSWDEGVPDPASSEAATEAVFSSQPFMTRQEPRLGYVWSRPTVDGIPRERWAVAGETTVELDAGEYSLRTISDDGLRVWVDDELVIDHWDPHGSLVDYAPISPGRHRIRIRFYQVDSWTELRVDVVRGSARSQGSPGPH